MKKNNIITAFLFAGFMITVSGLTAFAATYTTDLPEDITWYTSLSGTTTTDAVVLSTSSTKSLYSQAPDGRYIDRVYITYNDGETPDADATVTYDGARKRYTVKFPKVSGEVKEIAVVLNDTENVYLQYTNVEDIGTDEASSYRGYKISIYGTLETIDGSPVTDVAVGAIIAGRTVKVSSDESGNIILTSKSIITANTSVSVYSNSKEYNIADNALDIVVPSRLSNGIFSVTDYIKDNTTDESEDDTYGSITINDTSKSYVYSVKDPNQSPYNAEIKNIENNVITDLTDGTYYIRSKPYYDNAATTYYLASEATNVTVNKSTYETVTVNFTAGKNVTYSLEKDGESISSLTFAAVKSQSSSMDGSVDVYYDVDEGYILDGFNVNSASGTANVSFNDGILTISAPTTKSFYIAANTRQAGAPTQIGALNLSAHEDSKSGNSALIISGTLLSDGSGISGKTVTLYNGSSTLLNATTDQNGDFKFEISNPVVGNYAFSAGFKGDDDYDKSTSDTLNVTVVKPEAPQITHVIGTSGNGAADGSLEIVSDLPDNAEFEYNKTRNPDAEYSGTSLLDLQKVSGKNADSLSAGKYYVRNATFINGNTFYLPSSSTEISIASAPYTVTLNRSGVEWNDEDGNSVQQITVRVGETKTVRLATNYDTYDILPLEYDTENAEITYDASTGTVTLSDLKKSISVNAVAIKKNFNYVTVKTNENITVNDNIVNGNVQASIYGRNSDPINAVAILAAYSNNRLEFSIINDIILQGSKTDVVFDIDNESVNTYDIEYKIFIWDSLNSIQPLTE
ncbi:MAG: Ig-like domain-containing protein [Firmicutes bacterium]|nr:Ig-like domain-containing protein [Bacillota bacterium]